MLCWVFRQSHGLLGDAPDENYAVELQDRLCWSRVVICGAGVRIYIGGLCAYWASGDEFATCIRMQ